MNASLTLYWKTATLHKTCLRNSLLAALISMCLPSNDASSSAAWTYSSIYLNKAREMFYHHFTFSFYEHASWGRDYFLESYTIHFAVGRRRPFGPPLPTAQRCVMQSERITYSSSASYRLWLQHNTAATLGNHVSDSMSSALALCLVRQHTLKTEMWIEVFFE